VGQNSSTVSISNQALGWLGLDSITSLDDPSKSAQLCKLNLPALRDATLEDVEWTFAQRRAILPKSTVVPLWGYASQFDLPADCIRVHYATQYPDTYESSPIDQWVREGRAILANVDSVYIRYTYRSIDPGEWSEAFCQSLAARLASVIAIAATNSREHMESMWKLYGTLTAEASVNDGRQGRRQVMRSNDLKLARLGQWRG